MKLPISPLGTVAPGAGALERDSSSLLIRGNCAAFAPASPRICRFVAN